MKKLFIAATIIALLFAFTGCSGGGEEEIIKTNQTATEGDGGQNDDNGADDNDNGSADDENVPGDEIPDGDDPVSDDDDPVTPGDDDPQTPGDNVSVIACFGVEQLMGWGDGVDYGKLDSGQQMFVVNSNLELIEAIGDLSAKIPEVNWDSMVIVNTPFPYPRNVTATAVIEETEPGAYALKIDYVTGGEGEYTIAVCVNEVTAVLTTRIPEGAVIDLRITLDGEPYPYEFML